MSEDKLKKLAEHNGFGKIAKVLHRATILREGWEMDNAGWIVEMEDGSALALTTSHGGLCEWDRGDIEDCIRNTESSLVQLQTALFKLGTLPEASR